MINEYTGQLLTDGLRHQGRGYRGIDTAAQCEQYLTLLYGLADLLDLILYEGLHLPVACALADIIQEVMEELVSLDGVLYLRVELYGVDLTCRIFHAGHRTVCGMGDDMEALRYLGDVIRVGHPHRGLIGDALQYGILTIDEHLRVSILGNRCGLNDATELIRDQLCTVADAEDRDSHREDGRVDMLGLFLIHGLRSAGKDDSLRVQSLQLIEAHGRRMHLGIDTEITNSSCD